MLKKLILENWKSFRYAELYFDPLTVLIGTNASGKSNLVEALEFLRRMATGETVDVALNGDRALPPIRGGSQFAALHSRDSFTLKIVIENNQQDYLYNLLIFSNRNFQKVPCIWNEDIQWSNAKTKFDNPDFILDNKITLFEFGQALDNKLG
ncbi:MAG: AAA family ATPase, partial [Microcystaceae cyanobacterium]